MDEKRILLAVLALTLALLLGGTVASLSAASLRTRHVPRRAISRVQPKLLPRHVNPQRTLRLRATVWRWESIIGRRHSKLAAPLASPRALHYWSRRARRLLRAAKNPPHKAQWLCIHRFEGSWRDSGDPYWGGLQMDRGFMRSYAPALLLRRGWANSWSALEQMWVAERAHRTRGFYPWPNTARYCGLL
jgi:hypothetical protein